MDLLSFIRTVDPTKVRVAERQRTKDKPRLLETTVGRVVLLLPVARARASSELEASVDNLFDDGVGEGQVEYGDSAGGKDGQGADIQSVIVTTNTIVEDVAPLQPRRQRKRKIGVADASGPSHPPKKLKEDYGALARGEPIPTIPFVTSSVSATPEREDKSPADSVTALNLRTIGALQRFVISSDSFHHSGTNIAEAEVDSIVRSSAPAIATVTTVTVTVDVATTADRIPVEPSSFGVGSSSTGRTDSVPGAFLDVSGSDFLIGGICTVVEPDFDLQKVYVPQWSATNGFGLDDSRICHEILDEFAPLKFFASIRGMDHDQLFTKFNVKATRQISLSAEVRMHAEYNIRAKRRLRYVVDEQAKLLKRLSVFRLKSSNLRLLGSLFKVKWGVLRDHSATLKKEKNELSVKVTDLSASVKVRISTLKPLFSTYFYAFILLKVHELEISSVGLQEKVVVYKDFIGQLKKFQDKKMDEDVSHSRVRKIRENIASHVSALRVVFVLVSEPLSTAALVGKEGTSSSAHDTTTALSVTFVSAGTIPPISTDDYEVAHADGQEGASVDGETAADENIDPFLMLATQS
nr:hypothetical protein [Tanacetum cinerariifolium]